MSTIPTMPPSSELLVTILNTMHPDQARILKPIDPSESVYVTVWDDKDQVLSFIVSKPRLVALSGMARRMCDEFDVSGNKYRVLKWNCPIEIGVLILLYVYGHPISLSEPELRPCIRRTQGDKIVDLYLKGICVARTYEFYAGFEVAVADEITKLFISNNNDDQSIIHGVAVQDNIYFWRTCRLFKLPEDLSRDESQWRNTYPGIELRMIEFVNRCAKTLMANSLSAQRLFNEAPRLLFACRDHCLPAITMAVRNCSDAIEKEKLGVVEVWLGYMMLKMDWDEFIYDASHQPRYDAQGFRVG